MKQESFQLQRQWRDLNKGESPSNVHSFAEAQLEGISNQNFAIHYGMVCLLALRPSPSVTPSFSVTLSVFRSKLGGVKKQLFLRTRKHWQRLSVYSISYFYDEISVFELTLVANIMRNRPNHDIRGLYESPVKHENSGWEQRFDLTWLALVQHPSEVFTNIELQYRNFTIRRWNCEWNNSSSTDQPTRKLFSFHSFSLTLTHYHENKARNLLKLVSCRAQQRHFYVDLFFNSVFAKINHVVVIIKHTTQK